MVEPGGGTSGPYRLDTATIFALGLSGSTRLIVGGETRMLSAGVSTSFSGRTLHQFDNPGTTASEGCAAPGRGVGDTRPAPCRGSAAVPLRGSGDARRLTRMNSRARLARSGAGETSAQAPPGCRGTA
ncbi:cupin domain-containing protein [Streptomyces misionensis]|uniref:cupin domain-containing protein n=1 Tax=Streptomyces misionensis TaxID=67331 RepID=UPI0038136887